MFSRLSNWREQFFFEAVFQGNISKVAGFIEDKHVSITASTQPGGKQALHIACQTKQISMVDKLIELGADIQATSERGFTPLHVAAQLGDEAILMALIRAGADVNAVADNGIGTTPLQEAAHNGHLSAINILITAGADTQYCERKYNLTAADLARQAGHHDSAIALLGYKKAFIQKVSGILKSWANVFLKNTPQHNYYLSLRNIPEVSDADDYFKELKIKLEQGYQAIKEDVQKLRSTIITAMKQYNADKLLEQKIKSILPSKKQLSMLSNAVSKGNYSQVEEALTTGEDVNQIIDTHGNTPILLALKLGFHDIAKLLIQKGANLLIENKYGETAMDACSSFETFQSVIASGMKVRRENKVKEEKINNFLNYQQINYSLWKSGNTSLKSQADVATALTGRCDLEEKDLKGRTPLLAAIQNIGTFKIAIMLIKAGANINTRDKQGRSIADILPQMSIKKMPAKNKAAIEQAIDEIQQAQRHKKLLIPALSAGLYNRVEAAINNGEDINQSHGKNFDTPLIIALKNSYWNIAKLLLDHGASATMKNKQGMSAIDIAHQMNIPKIVTEALFVNVKESSKDSRSYSLLTTLWKQPKTPAAVEPEDEKVQNNDSYENLVLYYSVLKNIK